MLPACEYAECGIEAQRKRAGYRAGDFNDARNGHLKTAGMAAIAATPLTANGFVKKARHEKRSE
jgi:hypothetical protein